VPTLDLGKAAKSPLVIVQEELAIPPPRRDPVLVRPSQPQSRDPAEDAFEREQETAERSRRKLASLGSLGPVGNPESATMDVVASDLLADIERSAPPNESPDERCRRRISALLDRATAASRAGHHPLAVTALDLALDEEPDSAVSQKLIHRHRDLILDVYQGYIGDLGAVPALTMPMHDLSRERLDNRAAFLLSRIDGALSFEELLDITGMTRLETYRHLCRLLLRGIVEVR
jgi:hypothetical protein